MIIKVQITMSAGRDSIDAAYPTRRAAEVEIEPGFLPCLDVREIASKLAVGAFKEYLARQAEQEEAE